MPRIEQKSDFPGQKKSEALLGISREGGETIQVVEGWYHDVFREQMFVVWESLAHKYVPRIQE